jgi:hypothetical protein
MNLLEEHIKKVTNEFRHIVLNTITAGPRQILEPGGTFKTVYVGSGRSLRSQLNLICPTKDFYKTKQILREHHEELEKYISMASTPQAFKAAWDLRSNKLTVSDIETILSLGGQIIPQNNFSRVFKTEQQGVLYKNKRFILGIRHSEGNYDDKLDDLGRFSYQPPRDISGLLRYRFLERMSLEMKIDLVVLAIMWFDYKINNKIKQVFILAPAKILIQPNSDTVIDLNSNIAKPLEFQIIQRSEAFQKIIQIFSRDQSSQTIEIRNELEDKLAREFSYTQIKDSKKGKRIKKWAQNTARNCPGNICNNISFSSLSYSEISFGHIVSQQWGRSFPHIQGKIDHPDNLYLTCKRCNSSLLDYFPDNNLRDRIISCGTIGDWLRANEQNIRNTPI